MRKPLVTLRLPGPDVHVAFPWNRERKMILAVGAAKTKQYKYKLQIDVITVACLKKKTSGPRKTKPSSLEAPPLVRP